MKESDKKTFFDDVKKDDKFPESKIFLIKYFLLNIISGIDFIMPYIILIFSKYLAPSQVAVVFTCQAAVKLFLVPIGALADRFGRKKFLLLGQASLIVGVTLLYFSKAFWICCIVMILWGFCEATFSAAWDSLFYNNMEYYNLHNDYAKYQIRSGIVFSAVSACSFFSAGIIMKYYNNFDILILLFLMSLILYFIVLASIKDYTNTKAEEIENNYFKILKQSFAYILRHPTLLKLSIFSSLFIGMYIFLSTYDGIYLKDITKSESMVGILSAAYSIIAFFASIILEKKVNKQNIIKLSRNFAVFSIFLVLAYSIYDFPYSWIFGSIFWMVVVISTNAFMAKEQVFIPSRLRATINSTISMGFELVKICYILSFGFISQNFSNKAGFVSMGWLTFLVCIIFYFIFTTDENLKKQEV